MNVLIIGTNTRHARLFSLFSDKVFIATSNIKTRQNRLNDEINDYVLIVSNNRLKNIKDYFARIKEIKKWVKEYCIDIVLTNRKDDMLLTKLAFIFKSFKKRPIILSTFHNSLAWKNTINVKKIAKWINRCADGCICLCKQCYDLLVGCGIRKDRLLYQPNTIDYKLVKQKNDYSIHDNILNIVCVSTIYPNKNQLFALELFKKLINHHNARLTFYGDFTDETYYKQLIDYSKNNGIDKLIYFAGSVDNDILRNKLCEFDIYLSTSKMEMSPINILEAKAAGLPIVASHAFGQQDLIHHGFDGFLYDDNCIDNALSFIELLANDLKTREKLGRNAIENLSFSRTVEAASSELNNFIENIKKDKK